MHKRYPKCGFLTFLGLYLGFSLGLHCPLIESLWTTSAQKLADDQLIHIFVHICVFHVGQDDTPSVPPAPTLYATMFGR